MLTNLDETSDIHNFSSTVKVIEFVGIDPGYLSVNFSNSTVKTWFALLRKSYINAFCQSASTISLSINIIN